MLFLVSLVAFTVMMLALCIRLLADKPPVQSSCASGGIRGIRCAGGCRHPCKRKTRGYTE